MKQLLIIGFAAALFLTSAPFTYADIYGSSLIGWWTLDSNDISGTSVTDKAGNSNTGTTVNSPTATTGKLGQALKFNGTSQKVTIQPSATMQFSGTSITVSAWLFQTSSPSRDIAIAGGRTACGGSINWQFYAKVVPAEGGYNAPFFSVGSIAIDASSSIPLNTWTHLVGVDDGSHFYIYQNGVLVGSITGSGGTVNRFSTLTTFGDESCGNFFPGTIDDVRIYSTALSAKDIMTLYYQGESTHFNEIL